MLCVDLYCGLGGWAEGFLSEGYEVVGFDIEHHDYGTGVYPGQFVMQDVTTLVGSQFKKATCIVASPPCQAYSYRAMPWSRAKALPPPDNTLFETCFRIQREASEAAGHHVPLIVENVCGAQKWVGRAGWHFGSYYLWGDIPALMPFARSADVKVSGQDWNRFKETGEVSPHWRMEGQKTKGHVNKRDGHTHTRHLTNQRESDAVKNGNDCFGSSENCSLQRRSASKSRARARASAEIAKIPFPLASYIAKHFKNAQRSTT